MSKETQKGIFASDNYLDLCKPFPSASEADSAIEAFYSDLYELRNKHRMTDVHVMIRLPVEGHFVQTCFHFGDELLAEPMAAWNYGYQGAQRQIRMGQIVERGCDAVRIRPNKK